MIWPVFGVLILIIAQIDWLTLQRAFSDILFFADNVLGVERIWPRWRKVLRDFYEVDEDGNPVYNEMVACVGMGCLVEDTDINTPSGDVEIRDLDVGDEVFSWDNDNKLRVVSRVAGVESKVKDSVRIVLEDGRDVVCSLDHRFPVIRSNNRLTDMKSNNISSGDTFLVSRKFERNLSTISMGYEWLEKNNVRKEKGIYEFPNNINKIDKMNIVLGLVESDGYSDGYSYFVTNSSEEIVNFLEKLLESIGVRYSKTVADRDNRKTKYIINFPKIEFYYEKVKVKGVEDVGEKRLVDISLDNTPYFELSNGILSHNSGKTYIGAIIATYEFFKLLQLPNPQKHWNLDQATPIYIVNLGKSQAQAKETVFAFVKGFLTDSEYFLDMIESGVIRQRHNEFEHTGKNVFLRSEHSASGSLAGKTSKCVDGDTFVLTVDGFKKIRDIETGEELPEGIVVGKTHSGVSKGIKLVTRWGYSVKCTKDHLIMVDGAWKEAGDIEVGDLIDFSIQVPRDDYREVSDIVECSVDRYDIQVSPSKRFTANGMIVHNCVIFDELAKLDFTKSGSESSAQEVYSIVSKATGRFGMDGKILSISSPISTDDLFWDLLEKGRKRGNDLGIYTVHEPTWNMVDLSVKPEYAEDSQMMKKERNKDYDKFLRDYGAKPVGRLSPFFPETRPIKMCELTDRENPIEINNGYPELAEWFTPENHKYIIAGDPALKKDAFGLAMGHMEDDIINIDFTTKFERVPPRQEIDAVKVREFLVDILDRGFNVVKFITDIRTFPEMFQELEKRGVVVEQSFVKKKTYDYLKERINLNEIFFPKNVDLFDELSHLEIVSQRKVDHPKHGSKDIADALANVAFFVKDIKTEEPLWADVNGW